MSDGIAGLDLGKNVGPLPMGAWVAVVGAGLAYGYYSRKKSAAASNATTDTVDTSVPSGVGTGAVGGYVDNTTANPSAVTAPTIATNDDWGRAVTNYLIAQGYDPAVSDSATRKYLASASLSVTEYALIKVALLKYGAPPEMLPQLPADAPVTPTAAPAPAPPVSVPGPVYTAAAPPAPAPAPQHVYYVVKPGDSLSRIAARYPQSWITWQSIYNNNRSLIGGNPGLIHPGQNLLIY